MNKVKNSSVHQTLRRLRLTDYETRTYICLAEKGSLSAGEISRLAEVPHSKTYEVLTRLEKRGLIEVQRGRPMIYRAVKPTIAFERLEKELKSNLEKEFQEKKTSLEDNFKQRVLEVAEARRAALEELGDIFEKSTTMELSEDAVWTIKGADSLNAEAKDLIMGADRRIRLILPRDDFSAVEEAIKTASSKGVNIQLIVHNLTSSVNRLSGKTEVFQEKAIYLQQTLE